MRKGLLAVVAVYSLLGLLYVLSDPGSNGGVRAGAKTRQCPPVEIAPRCGQPDLHPTVVP